jgi:cytochrome c oxidase subunit 4
MPAEDDAMAHHPDPKRSLMIYFAVFGALLLGTLATVLVAEVDLGVMNDVVALGIAVTKALLVILFFMHVRYSTRLTALTALAGFFWLALLILFTLSDYMALGKILPVPGK